MKEKEKEQEKTLANNLMRLDPVLNCFVVFLFSILFPRVKTPQKSTTEVFDGKPTILLRAAGINRAPLATAIPAAIHLSARFAITP